MNTSKLISAIATLSLVLFMSIASIADSNTFYSGDLPKSGDKSVSVASTTDKDFSYLRFDVNKYVNENEKSEVAHSSLDYLRFDVTYFMNETEVSEMPAIELDYLRFDVNNYIETENSESMELPVTNEFDYLRFEVNNFIDANSSEIIELPANDFDYLRFDVNKFASTTEGFIDELPITE